MSETTSFGVRRILFAAAVAVVILVIGLVGQAWAMRVSPMVSEISTVGAGASARIEIQNLNSSPLPYETSITKISFSADGSIVETPADEDFLVFPPQGIAAPGGRQVIRAQFIGDPGIGASSAYYMAIRQLPVDLNQSAASGTATVQVVYHMKTLIIVTPPGSESNVQILSVESAAIERPGVPPATRTSIETITGTPAVQVEERPASSIPAVKVRLRNTGMRHAVMSGVTWMLEGTDEAGQPLSVTLNPGDISGAIGVGYLPPEGGERVLTLPTGKAFGPGAIQLRFAG